MSEAFHRLVERLKELFYHLDLLRGLHLDLEREQICEPRSLTVQSPNFHHLLVSGNREQTLDKRDRGTSV